MSSIYATHLTATERHALAKHTGHDLTEEIDLLRTLINRELTETADIDSITKTIDSIRKAELARHRLQTSSDDVLRLALITALNNLDSEDSHPLEGA